MSRWITNLEKFDDINILLKYLYLSEDHNVEYENSMGTVFSLRMEDDMELKRKIVKGFEGTVGLEFKGHDMTHEHLMAITEQLKETPAKDFPERFSNRFEEIKTITLSNLALNYNRQKSLYNRDVER